MIELLSPVGNVGCLKAAVQSGANAVYLGADTFNARQYASNFNKDTLADAIEYAKLRNVKVHFVLNTLIKDSEFSQAVELVKLVYALGADAIIVQDLGLAQYIIANFPGIDVHASTQMTTHNLDGVLKLQDLGFKRAILSRELSLREIEYICSKSNIEIETFVHGALCISYSGQCLFSSIVGGRSGNRGRCAQPCRLAYKLIEETNNSDKTIDLDKGYLLSPRDLCGLNYIPELIDANVTSLKIEGRMKSPEYVATVTRIYRKYIDLAYSGKNYIVKDEDVKELMQAFNRGGFSSGNFENEPNTTYVYKEKPNNIGVYSGNVSHYENKKGLITFITSSNFKIGDKYKIGDDDYVYTVSELMKNGKNIPKALPDSTITIGRAKGKIKPGDKIFKITSQSRISEIDEFIKKENIKIPIVGRVVIKKGLPITLEVKACDDGIYSSLSAKSTEKVIPDDAISSPLTEERIMSQLSKTSDTPFYFSKIHVDMDSNIYLPKISALNKLRRECIESLLEQARNKIKREEINGLSINKANKQNKPSPTQVSLLLNTLYENDNYNLLENVDNIYIPFNYFIDKRFSKVLINIAQKGNLYIYMPTIIKDNYRNVILDYFEKILQKFPIKGMVISNISCLNYFKQFEDILDIVADFNFNIFNNYTINTLKELGINRITLSPELDKKSLQQLSLESSLPTELLVYGKLPLMHTGYCLLGKTNKCYPKCKTTCKDDSRFFLEDRYHLKFRVVPDNLQTVSTIYNSKITSIKYSDIKTDYIRISIIDRPVEKINSIVRKVRQNKVFVGHEYTKGNLNKYV